MLSTARFRILGWYVALLAVALVVTVLVQRRLLLERLDEEVGESLTQEMGELQRLALGSDPMTGRPFGDDVQAIFDVFLARNVPNEGESFFTFVGGDLYTATPAPLDPEGIDDLIPEWRSVQETSSGEVLSAAGPVRFVAAPVPSAAQPLGTFVVANFLRHEREEVDLAVRVTALSSATVLALGSALAWAVAGRVLAPVRSVIATTREITETDLDRRIPVQGSGEIAELSRTVNAMLDRLDAAFVTQRAFVDDAGHELRTPITIIRGHLEVMGDEPEDRAATNALVLDELGRMSRIVDDLLLLARAERPGFLRLQPVELALFTASLHAKACSLAPRSWRVEAVGSGALVADPQRLTQAIMNLADNAAHHTPVDSELFIGSANTTSEARFWVRDSGPGIPEGDRDRIFSRFVRGARGRRSSDGAGLGLAIVQVIAEAHGGRVELDSAPGRGSTFTLVLPLPG